MSADDPTTPEALIAAAIDAAEDIRDPLDGLVEKTTTDPGAPFVPDVLESLGALKKEDRAAFEVLRARLKKAGCRVAALDKAIAEESGETGGRGLSQADILIDLAQSAELFHTPDGMGYADLDINGQRETWPIRGKGFRRWLARRFFEARRVRRVPRRCNRRSTSSRRKHISMHQNASSIFASADWMTSSTSIFATGSGGRSRLTPPAGGWSTIPRCASVAPPG